MSDSYIGYRPDGHAESFVGEAAVDLFRAASLASMLGMMNAGLKFKQCTPTRALQLAGEYTGVKYKRGEYLKAKDDLYKLVRERKAQIPAVRNG